MFGVRCTIGFGGASPRALDFDFRVEVEESRLVCSHPQRTGIGGTIPVAQDRELQSNRALDFDFRVEVEVSHIAQ